MWADVLLCTIAISDIFWTVFLIVEYNGLLYELLQLCFVVHIVIQF